MLLFIQYIMLILVLRVCRVETLSITWQKVLGLGDMVGGLQTAALIGAAAILKVLVR